MDESRKVERHVELPVEPAAVWQTLTRGAELSAWFGAHVEMEARRGGRASFRWPDGRQREARVDVFDVERQLLLRWLPFERGADGTSSVTPPGHIRFVLEAHEGRTLLTVTETLLGEERAMTMAGGRQLQPTSDKPVDAVSAAPSDPTRRSVMRLLSEGDANATEIADQLPISRQAVTKHLSALSEAGLVTSARDGREKRYHFTPAPFRDVRMADVGAGWDHRLDALQELLQHRP